MKKTTRSRARLPFKKETLKTLSAGELTRANGGLKCIDTCDISCTHTNYTCEPSCSHTSYTLD